MLRGPYKGREDLYAEAISLREIGYGYRMIAAEIGISWWTVRNWVKDIKVDPEVSRKLSRDALKIRMERLTSKGAIRLRLIEERGHRCEWCKLSEWLDKPIWLEMHRIGGPASSYNDRENVLLLCLNCHSTTKGYRNRAGVA